MSEWLKIKAYALAWSIDKNEGKVRLLLDDGLRYESNIDNVTELAVLADILRNEKPSFYSSEKRAIRTGWELGE